MSSIDEQEEGTPIRGKLRSFAAAKGHIRSPVAGKVVQMFGDEDRREASRGDCHCRTRGCRGHGPL